MGGDEDADGWRARAAKLAGAGVDKAQELAAEAAIGERLRGLLAMDDEAPITPEVLVLAVVGAVRGDEAETLTADDLELAASRRQRAAGFARTLGGPVGGPVFGLYCDAAVFCDVAQLHRLGLSDEDLAAHVLVFWNVAPSEEVALAALRGTGPPLVSVAGRHVSEFPDKPLGEMKKREVVMVLWKAAGAGGDFLDEHRPRRRDVLVPGRRVRAAIRAAEEQLGVTPPPQDGGGLRGRLRRDR